MFPKKSNLDKSPGTVGDYLTAMKLKRQKQETEMDQAEREKIQEFFMELMDQVMLNDPQNAEELQYQLGAIGVLLRYYEAFRTYFDAESCLAIDQFIEEMEKKHGVDMRHPATNK